METNTQEVAYKGWTGTQLITNYGKVYQEMNNGGTAF
jgi:hypothetical protein